MQQVGFWLLAQPCPSPAMCQGLIQEGLQGIPSQGFLREPLCLPAVRAATPRAAALLFWVCWKGVLGIWEAKGEQPAGSRVSLQHPPDKHRRDNLWECLLRGGDADSSWVDDPEEPELLWCLWLMVFLGGCCSWHLGVWVWAVHTWCRQQILLGCSGGYRNSSCCISCCIPCCISCCILCYISCCSGYNFASSSFQYGLRDKKNKQRQDSLH